MPVRALAPGAAHRALAWLAIVAASIAFRLPFLVNAAGTNSDAAVVGLQATHLLRGELSPFLWGSGYQTSTDSFIAAAVFLITGPSPLALTASTLAGHVVLTVLAFEMLRRAFTADASSRRGRVDPSWIAAALVTPLVFTPDPLHTYILYPPRQAALTIAFVALWATHGALQDRLPAVRFGAGGAIASLAVAADPYALVFLPAQLFHAVLTSIDDDDRPAARRRVGAWALGAVLGMIPYLELRRLPEATTGQTSLSVDVVTHNAKLLVETCGPWLLSTRVYAAIHMTDYAPWDAGPFHVVQLLGAVTLTVGLVSSVPLARSTILPWEVRRLGLVGALLILSTLGGFLVSPMVMDQFSSRYLAAILLAAPFALAPAFARLGASRATLALAPYLVSAAVAGWISFRPFGLTRHPTIALDKRLGLALRERDIEYAVADYWASYRLTFAWRESPIVVPTNQGEDRHAAYRAAFDREPRVAYIHDALRSREALADVEAKIHRGETPFEPRYDRIEMDTFTVLLLVRRHPPETVASGAER